MLCNLGYPISDLSRRYRDKVENKLLQGGQEIPFSNSFCTLALKKCIEGIFYPHLKEK